MRTCERNPCVIREVLGDDGQAGLISQFQKGPATGVSSKVNLMLATSSVSIPHGGPRAFHQKLTSLTKLFFDCKLGHVTPKNVCGTRRRAVMVKQDGVGHLARLHSTRRTTDVSPKVNLPHAIDFVVQIWSRNTTECWTRCRAVMVKQDGVGHLVRLHSTRRTTGGLSKVNLPYEINF